LCPCYDPEVLTVSVLNGDFHINTLDFPKEEMAMVVLVRCNDDTCSVALETCLEGLVKGGLITAYLDKGEWVSIPREIQSRRVCATRRTVVDRVSAAVA
jgi:hypothetical protein